MYLRIKIIVESSCINEDTSTWHISLDHTYGIIKVVVLILTTGSLYVGTTD